jgi:hypothetical protein
MPRGVYERKPFTKEHIKNLSKAHKGKPLTEEHKRKIGESSKGRVPWNKGKLCPDQSKRMKNRIVSNETREKMSKSHRFMSKENRAKISKRMMGNTYRLGIKHSLATRQKISNGEVGKMPKNMQNGGAYSNIKRGYYNINGKDIFFRSKWEANYALYLDFLIKQRQIKSWTYEKDVFIFEKIKFGTRSYRPDFKIYNNDDTFEYHEVKGYMDARSKTKIKRMAKYYPKTKLVIIDSATYKDIRKKIGKMLKFYE